MILLCLVGGCLMAMGAVPLLLEAAMWIAGSRWTLRPDRPALAFGIGSVLLAVGWVAT